MSDITINLCFSDDAAQRRTVTKNKKNRNKRIRKKMRLLKQKGLLEGGHGGDHQTGQSRHNPPPRLNGAPAGQPSHHTSSHDRSLPRPSSSGGAAHCSSETPSSTVNTSGRHEKPKDTVKSNATTSTHLPSASSSNKSAATPTGIPTKFLAIDCEMVGTGPKGSISQLARCSLVNYDGDVVYDKFINPSVPVTDYRTRWSGIRRSDLVNATQYSEARREILRLLMGKVVVGHAIHNDFKVLGYAHPAALTRDTSRIPLLNLKAGFAEHECASLKRLTKAIFNRDIQTGKRGHSSVEDARATMELYRVVEEEWERTLASRSQAASRETTHK
ncbi:interferon-stimulated 20 kDa exonuclease-like 2 [Plectropomus leopardus]|uniref:interferon-stimulated 20 kDa exonuclease-like 2 n=1 Tax=Plectropomus leopardus TaxID=160734 RepID=UPI001C4B347D|nr:interferon-stimulated 20 kDa exonuclease-like 2 [Plectropomus leopardus]